MEISLGSSIERLKKRVASKKEEGGFEYVNTRASVTTFENLPLPAYVNILGKRIYLNPFIQRVQRCIHCQRFGHIKNLCKNINKPNICDRCGGEGHEESKCLTEVAKCINCVRAKYSKYNHFADNPDCPALAFQKEIKKRLATLCISPSEAIHSMGKNQSQPFSDNYTYASQVYDNIPLPTLREFIPALGIPFGKISKSQGAPLARKRHSNNPIEDFPPSLSHL